MKACMRVDNSHKFPSFNSHFILYQVGAPQGSLSGPPQKRVGQISQQQQQQSSDNYINVAFDLVDLSDDPTPPKSPGALKRNPRGALLNVAKPPLSRKSSAPEYVTSAEYATVDKSRNHLEDTSSDYVIVPPRG